MYGIVVPEQKKSINKWIDQYLGSKKSAVCLLDTVGTDFQHSKFVCLRNANFIITSHSKGIYIDKENLIQNCIYISARHCIKAEWFNDRDQFLYPRTAWKDDLEFQNDCLAFILFHGQNKITASAGINHWIPFYEKEISAPMLFQSHFMADFIAGKLATQTLFDDIPSLIPSEPIQFSNEAQAVMDAGRELWKYYMTKKDNINFNVNASYYDIRLFFKGRDEKGKMNKESKDVEFNALMDRLSSARDVLAKKIEPKVYRYGFLLGETTLPEDEIIDVEPQEQKPSKPTKKAQKKSKPSSQAVEIHYHIDHIETLNIGDKVEHKYT